MHVICVPLSKMVCKKIVLGISEFEIKLPYSKNMRVKIKE